MGLDGIITWIVLLGIVYIFYNISAKRKKASREAHNIKMKLDELQKEIICVGGSIVPNRTIEEVFGTVSGLSSQVTSDEEFALSEKQAMYNMLLRAKELGANAITDVKLATGTYQQSGSQWQSAQCIYTGTAVKVI
jgi:uncharacterized protein YbjQ (UPF0145 family)